MRDAPPFSDPARPRHIALNHVDGSAIEKRLQLETRRHRLTRGDSRPDMSRELRVTFDIVAAQRLLDQMNVIFLEAPDAFDRRAAIPFLAGVNHEQRATADRLAHG